VVASGCSTLGGGTGQLQSKQAADRAGSIPSLESVPQWALATTRRTGDEEIGIGSGRSLDGATRYALQDVASRLSVSIESQLTDVQRESNGATAESIEQVIQTRVLGTRFTGWERTRSVQVDDVFWVEIRIDRRRLIRDSLFELSELADDVDARLSAATGSALRRLGALHITADDRERVRSLIALIDGLDSNFDRALWDARRLRWRRADESARRALIFEIRSDPESREIARWLESELATEQLAIRSGGCASREAVCIDIRSEISEAAVANRHVTRIRSFFAVREPGGSVFQERDLTGRGTSPSDPARARREALDDLRSRLTGAKVLDQLLVP